MKNLLAQQLLVLIPLALFCSSASVAGQTVTAEFISPIAESHVSGAIDVRETASWLLVISLIEGGKARVMWENSGALRYEVYRRERLEEGEWEKVEDIEPEDGTSMEYVVSVDAGVGSMYYRVVEVPDPLTELKTLDLGNGVEVEMVMIEAGEFTMGSLDGDLDEGSLTEVKITKPFLMGKYEVTIDQFRAFLLDGGSKDGLDFSDSDCPIRDDRSFSLRNNVFGQNGNQPMVEISWEAAVNFCEWMTGRARSLGILPSGYEFGLPSEAEWEYACRSGNQTRYSYGDDLNYAELDNYAWYLSNSGDRTHPVGEKLPNGWGLYDMHGNVYEWCRDWYGSYPGGSVEDWVQPEAGSIRVGRGGSWHGAAWGCRSTYRIGWSPSNPHNILGFRLAAVPVP